MAAQFGDPDLYVSANNQMPNTHVYTWASRSSGSETLSIPSSDPRLCRSCVLVVGVLAKHSNSRFTITAAVEETLVTLQASVPLPAQEVRAGSYRFYRFFVDGSDEGLTVGLTVQTGDADVFVSLCALARCREVHVGMAGADGRNESACRDDKAVVETRCRWLE